MEAEELTLRFWSKVEVGHEDECWEWLAGRRRSWMLDGVRVSDDYGNWRGDAAHREMFRRLHGAIPPGYVVDHVCENKRCVNPHHLEAVSNGENVRRAVANRRSRSEAQQG